MSERREACNLLLRELLLEYNAILMRPVNGIAPVNESEEEYRLRKRREREVEDDIDNSLQFIEDEYVEKDDDASHYTWGHILTTTRMPKTSIFAWVDSFTLLTLRYGETVDEVSKLKQIKINRVVAKQITDDEKLTIATLQSAFTAISIHNGLYPFSELVKLLAQNVTSFTKRYTPHEPRYNDRDL